MSFDELKKYGSMDNAFKAGLEKSEPKVVSMGEFLRKLDKANTDKMGDKAFENLEKQLDLAIGKVNKLQKIYRNQTGKDYVPILYI